MKKISEIVEEIIENDDLVKAVAARGILNNRAYARTIQDRVEEKAFKDVKLGSITTAVSRYFDDIELIKIPPQEDIKQISVHTQLAGLTYERSDELSIAISEIYKNLEMKLKTYITVTQGINEVTIIAEQEVINTFKEKLSKYSTIYDISDIVGITVKFGLKYMKIPNMFYALIRKLAFRNINIIEIVSTATELTFILDKKDTQLALDRLQRSL